LVAFHPKYTQHIYVKTDSLGIRGNNMTLKELKKCTKKELIEYLIMLADDFRGYATIIDGNWEE
jgi:hypothetical protein